MRRFAAIFAVLMVCMSCLCMTAFAADDAYAIYKSSYVIAGYGSGVGSMAGTGETYGFYGGLIPGSGDIVGCTVRGNYNSGAGKYNVIYQIELAEPVTAYYEPICFIPITYDRNVSVTYSIQGYGVGILGPMTLKRENLATYNGQVTVCGLNYIVSESDVIPGSVSYVATVDDGLALPIVSTSSSATVYTVAVMIDNPEAVLEYPYDVSDSEVMLFPLQFILTDVPVMLTYMSSIIASPIVSMMVTIAAAALLLSIIVHLMR